MNSVKRRNIGLTTEPHITYTPCYNQHGKLPQMLD